MNGNPYNWQSHMPQVKIPRPDVELAVETLLGNGSAVFMGGRGMGKSVFLRQVKAALEQEPRTRVLLFIAAPAPLSVEACLTHLAQELGVERRTGLYSLDLFERYLAQPGAPEKLVLLFDEFDRYAEKGEPSQQPPGRAFFNDLEASRRELPQLGMLVASSIGVFIFRDVLGSGFLSRALSRRLRPFSRFEAARLAEPFAQRGTPLSDEVLDALLLASGGIPSLLTYGLQELWKLGGEPTVQDVTTFFKRFEEDHGEYLRDLMSAIKDPRFSDAPFRVWERIQRGSGRIARADLEAALGEPSGVLRLGLADALHLLEAVGLVRLESSALHDDPILVHPIPSLLNLSRSSHVEGDLRAAFLRDLVLLLAKLHRSSVDFFRPGRAGETKQLLPEAVFAAHLALGFELLGWRSEREAQRGAGRTDLLLRRNGDPQTVIVEVKIWGRGDYQQAQTQVERYWTGEVVAGAVVQLTDAEIPDWAERYRRTCLEPLRVEVEEVAVAGTPLQGRLAVSSLGEGGLQTKVEHLLLRLPRR